MIREGILHKTENDWIIRYSKYPTSNKIFEWKEVSLIPEDRDWVANSPGPMEGLAVEFELIDEFTNPQYYENVGWGDGVELAKLTV